jgi:hypothetical protein
MVQLLPKSSLKIIRMDVPTAQNDHVKTLLFQKYGILLSYNNIMIILWSSEKLALVFDLTEKVAIILAIRKLARG